MRSYFNELVWRNAALTLFEIALSRGGQALLFYFLALRYGPSQFGIVTFAFTVVYLAYIGANFGSATYGIKIVASGEGRDSGFLSSLMGFQILNAVVAVAVISGATLTLSGIGTEGLFIIIMAGTLIPDGVSGVIRVSFFGRERFLPMVILGGATSIAVLGMGLIAVHFGASLLQIGGLMLIISWLEAAAAIKMHSRLIAAIGMRLDRQEYCRLGRGSLPYLMITILGAIHIKADIPMIRLMLDRSDVGLYGVAAAAVGLTTALIQAIANSLLPAVARSAGSGRELSPSIALRTLRIPFGIGLALAVVISFAAGPAVSRFLGAAYAGSVRPLIILGWFLPFIFVSTVALRIMVACGETAAALRIVGVNCLVNIGANCVLIPLAGISGAAVSTVISAVASLAQCVWKLTHWASHIASE